MHACTCVCMIENNEKTNNKPTLVLPLISAYSFGDPSLRLTQEQIENQLHILLMFDKNRTNNLKEQ